MLKKMNTFCIKNVFCHKTLFMVIFGFTSLFLTKTVSAENGYDLWLRYNQVKNPQKLKQYQAQFSSFSFNAISPSNKVAAAELIKGMSGLLGRPFTLAKNDLNNGGLLIGTPKTSPAIAALKLEKKLADLGDEGYLITTSLINKKNCTVICANEDAGLLYGVYYFLQLLQTEQNTAKLSITNVPHIKNRILNHWDNLNGSVERGYAGESIWKWEELPGKVSKRYTDYARANASVGINGVVLNNVNANPQILTQPYLEKVKVLADVFRPYGIKVYFSVSFSSPITIGKLSTADPLNEQVKKWWSDKADEIYKVIPDFGGFCVKANSERQPGPQDYGRSHADGANMLADALKPHNGLVMWRAFVYGNMSANDRSMHPYREFKPFDGSFKNNVLLQVKNGPADFQPREPFHPLFGSMPKTQLMPEFQITQEYLGFSTYLVYLAPLFTECLQADTYTNGKGTTISKIVSTTVDAAQTTGMAGVANIGSAVNWCAHPFAQANWYAFGKLAWNPDADAGVIAEDWLRLTFGNNEQLVKSLQTLMLGSRQIAVDYMTPLGLAMLMDGSHYRPAPWRHDNDPSKSWHFAGASGIGYNRTSNGSDAVSQYATPVRDMLNNIHTCPEELLLWFHHINWNTKMKSGRILWDELCLRYQRGVDGVRQMRKTWQQVKNSVDDERFKLVDNLLQKQEEEAVIWKNTCLLYFQQHSKLPLPAGVDEPLHDFKYYRQLPLPKESK